MSGRRFPILSDYRERVELERLGCPESVPWSVVAPHAQQADRNHGQTLERLAERGGLSTVELVAVISGLPWNAVRGMGSARAVQLLRELGAIDTRPEPGEGERDGW